MGIIGLLIALLFGGVMTALTAMDETTCQNHLTQLAKVVTAYCQQNGSLFPLAVSSTSVKPSASNWIYAGPTGSADPVGFDNGMLVRLRYVTNTELFYCPVDEKNNVQRKASCTFLKEVKDNAGNVIRRQGPTSYAINASITYDDTPQYLFGSDSPRTVKSRRLDEFDANDFLFMEESDNAEREQLINNASEFNCGHMKPDTSLYHLTTRHRDGGFVACMDGHVEWFLATEFDKGMDYIKAAPPPWYAQRFPLTPPPPGQPLDEESRKKQFASRWNPG
jgi:hypothetical protein